MPSLKWRHSAEPYLQAVKARIAEVLDAERVWARAIDAANRDAGLQKAARRWMRLMEQRAGLYAAIGRTPARTPAGVVAKLLVAAPDVSRYILDFADDTAIEFILGSAVGDALALAGDGPDRDAQLAAIRDGQTHTTP